MYAAKPHLSVRHILESVAHAEKMTKSDFPRPEMQRSAAPPHLSVIRVLQALGLRHTNTQADRQEELTGLLRVCCEAVLLTITAEHRKWLKGYQSEHGKVVFGCTSPTMALHDLRTAILQACISQSAPTLSHSCTLPYFPIPVKKTRG